MTLSKPETASMARLDRILREPSDKKIGVFGLGASGEAMVRFLAKRGSKVVAADENTSRSFGSYPVEVELRIGPVDEQTFDGVDAVALSPGIDPRKVVVQNLLARGVPIFGELELAKDIPAKVVAITGTNGKSTVTALIGHLLRAGGASVFVGGNFGPPICAWLDSAAARTTQVAVLELSSFQLETAYRFRPDVAVVLNVAPDHLDRYPDLESYARAKQRLVENLSREDVAVLNREDPRVAAMSHATSGRVWWFSSQREDIGASGAGCRGSQLIPQGAAAPLGELSLEHKSLFGDHNRANGLASWLAVCALGFIDQENRRKMIHAYSEFSGLEHRLEWVAEVSGVRYINDSKATNDKAAAAGIKALNGPLIVLMGGYDKGGGYSATASALQGRARLVVVFGGAGPVIRNELSASAQTSGFKIVECNDLESALDRARREASIGDTVLLAPACSSFDAYDDYRKRGRHFKTLISQMTGATS